MWGISWLGSVSRGCGVSPGWDLSVGMWGISWLMHIPISIVQHFLDTFAVVLFSKYNVFYNIRETVVKAKICCMSVCLQHRTT